MDGHAHAGHARRVGHRQIVARLDRGLALDLDLAAEVHEEGAIGHVHDLHAFDGAQPLDDLLAVPLVAGLERQVARDRGLADGDDVDGADVAAALADRRGDLAEHAGLVPDLEPDRETVAGCWCRLHDASLFSAAGRARRVDGYSTPRREAAEIY